MKIVRYLAGSDPAWGLIEGETLFELADRPFVEWVKGAAVGPADEARLLAPLSPGKIVCIGRNYAAHAAELGNDVPPEPLIFLKPPSAVIGPNEEIHLPSLSRHVEHEAELVVVIGQRCRDLTEERAMEVVLGYTCGNDVTARDLQRRDGQWSRAKGFDTFCPLGPWIVTTDEFDPSAVGVRCTVNDGIRQDGNTRDLIFSLPRLLHDISAVMTLEPGDVIMTGTPAGVGPLEDGDVVKVEVEGIGALVNPVRG